MKPDTHRSVPCLDENVCPACLHPFGPRTAFCSACGAPVGMVANIDPIQHIYSEGYGFRSAADGPPRLIVVIGVWVLFLPIAVAGLLMLLLNPGDLFPKSLPMIFYALAGGTLIYRVTKNYRVKKHGDSEGEGGGPGTKITMCVLPAAAIFIGLVWYISPMVLGMGALMVCLWILLPLSLYALLSLLYAARNGTSCRRGTLILKMVGTTFCFLVAAHYANKAVYARYELAAKNYPALVGPVLENYRETHGKYPDNLESLPSRPQLPWLMRDRSYRSDGSSYEFFFAAPHGMMDIWHYHSRTKAWERS